MLIYFPVLDKYIGVDNLIYPKLYYKDRPIVYYTLFHICSLYNKVILFKF